MNNTKRQEGLARTTGISRRKLCKSALLAACGLALPAPLLARGTDICRPERQLSFYNTHTGESLKCATFWADGTYLADSLAEINRLLRDHRTGEIAPIDPNLLDQLFLLSRKLDSSAPLHVISGYRSPQTNDTLRRSGNGVARRSLHMDGRAIDIRLPGCDLKQLHAAAVNLQRGGVGLYQQSAFIHLDTGRVRNWRG